MNWAQIDSVLVGDVLFQNQTAFIGDFEANPIVKCLGIDHCAVGNIIGNKWHLGSMLLEALSYHHNPEDGTAQGRKFVSIIALANQLALQLNIGNAGDHFADPAKIEFLMADTGVDWTMISELQGAVSVEIERAKSFLEVVQNG